jgi:formate hydrogenlyase subunit 3/multisubunit Na+/H+ antiporter MnhD subunit
VIQLGIALAIWGVGAVLAWLLRHRAREATLAGVGSALVGAGIGAVGAAAILLEAGAEKWSQVWPVPFGALSLYLDPLAAVFILPICIVGGASALYGGAYLRPYAAERSIGAPLAAYNLLLASMTGVCLADNLLLFLVAWELMTLTSYALVVHDHGDPAVREAGRRYLIAAHLATATLVLLFLLLSAGGVVEVSALRSGAASAPAALLFILALVGFGTKAGLVPFHVWLPDAHPAAPSHVSALMSAVMITMGFYGLARFLPLFGPPPLWWGLSLMALGAIGALSGIAFALAQRDVKRVLAYSTIENAGIIALAFGVGVTGTTLQQPVLAGFGWSGGLLHLWNHSLFKALLFQGFGAAAQRAHSRDAEALGGLLRQWPLAGGLLILGAAAIASLPGLNGFTGEWLIAYGLLSGGTALRGAPQIALFAGLLSLALTGALAAACFTRLVGVTLLGEGRSEKVRHAAPPGWQMWLPMLALAALCIAAGWMPDRLVTLLAPAVASVAPGADTGPPAASLAAVGRVGLLVVLSLALACAVQWLLRRRAPGARLVPTWGCGYPRPAPRMQYTASSFAEPITRVLQPLLRTQVQRDVPTEAAWPGVASWRSFTRDRALAQLYEPLFSSVERALLRLRGLQQGRVTTYLLYIVLTVLALVLTLFLPVGPRP